MRANCNQKLDALTSLITSQMINDVISDVQQSVCLEESFDASNIYDFARQLETYYPKLSSVERRRKTQNGHYGFALKLFLQKFISENQEAIENWHVLMLDRQKAELGLKPTGNERFLMDDEGCYYQLENQIYEKVPEVVDVADDGSYVLKTPIKNKSTYFQVTYYNGKDVPVDIQVVDINNKRVQSLRVVAKLLNLRKEYVKKFKYSGYNGNSFDVCAKLFNLFVKPFESGCYMDEKYNFYTWDAISSCLKINIRKDLTPGSAMLSQYEFIDERTVVRTDYDGRGLQNFNAMPCAA